MSYPYPLTNLLSQAHQFTQHLMVRQLIARGNTQVGSHFFCWALLDRWKQLGVRKLGCFTIPGPAIMGYHGIITTGYSWDGGIIFRSFIPSIDVASWKNIKVQQW